MGRCVVSMAALRRVDRVVVPAAQVSKSSAIFSTSTQHSMMFEVKSNATIIATTPRTFGTFTTDDVAIKEYQAFLDSLSPAQKKFLDVLNEYRNKNFEHTMPKRFFAMIIKAVDCNHDGVITMEELQTLLINVGAREKMTDKDLDEIIETLGDDELEGQKVVSVERIEKAWAPFLNAIWKL
ncbi:hypothetical protein ACHAXH_002735 [Discostella pseudostelligera]|jgi:hypothetical protein